MRHLKRVKKLKRVKEHRVALLRNLAKSLLKYEKITITLAKAKVLRSYVEKLITKAKKGDAHNKRLVFAELRDKELTKKIFDNIALRYKNRNGGYTRIYKLYNRPSDSSEMALIELVEEKLDQEADISTETKIEKVETEVKEKKVKKEKKVEKEKKVIKEKKVSKEEKKEKKKDKE